MEYGNRNITLFPDDKETTIAYIQKEGLYIEKQFETEFANILSAVK